MSENQNFNDAPVEILPPLLRDYAVARAKARGCYCSLTAPFVVVAVGAATGKGIRLLTKYGSSYPNLYHIGLADPGVGKKVVREINDRLNFHSDSLESSWQNEEIPVLEGELAEIEAAIEKPENAKIRIKQIMEDAAAKAQNDDNAGLNALRKKAAAIRKKLKQEKTLIAKDVTSQALIPLLQANEESMYFMDSEGRNFIKNLLGRNSGGGFTDEDIYLCGWDQTDIKTNRVHSGKSSVSAPCLSAAIAVQPSAWESVVECKNFRGSGFFSRFTINHTPDSYALDEDIVPMDAIIEAKWGRLIDGLYKKYRHLSEDDRLFTGLSDEAQALMIAWRNEIVLKRKVGKANTAAMKELPVRWFENSLRIALVFHLVEAWDGDFPVAHDRYISAETAQRAIDWQRYLIREQLAYYFADAEAKREDMEQKTIELFRKKNFAEEGISPRAVQRYRIERDPNLAEVLLNEMAIAKRLVKINEVSPNGRKITRFYPAGYKPKEGQEYGN